MFGQVLGCERICLGRFFTVKDYIWESFFGGFGGFTGVLTVLFEDVFIGIFESGISVFGGTK